MLHCRSGRFVRRSCSPFPAGFRHPRGFPALSLGNRGTGPPDRKGRRGRGGISPGTPAPAPFQPRHHAPHLATPARAGAILAAASRPGCTQRTRAISRGRCSTPERRRSGRDRRGRLPDSWLLSPPAVRPRLNRGRRQPAARRDPLIRGRHGHSFAASRTDPARPVAGAAWQTRRPPPVGALHGSNRGLQGSLGHPRRRGSAVR